MSDTVKPLSLSQAIRLGAMLKPQAFGQLFDGESSCAQGAAADALGMGIDTWTAGTPTIWFTSWPDNVQWMFSTTPPACPECGQMRAAVDCLIRHLNDEHRWTRERIADHVEQIEQQQAASTVPILDQCEQVTA